MEDLLRRGWPAESPAGDGHLIGERLVRAGLIRREQLEKALALQRESGEPLGRVLMAEGWIRPLDFYRELAAQWGLPFVNLVDEPAEAEVFDTARHDEYARRLYVPWRRRNGRLFLALAEPDADLLARLRAEYGPETGFMLTSRLDIVWTIQRLASERLVSEAAFYRAATDPDHSARRVVTPMQMVFGALACGVFLAGLLLKPGSTVFAGHAMLGCLLLGSFLLRAFLVWRGSSTFYQSRSTPEELAALVPGELPVYSVLVPLYRDAAVVPRLAKALRSLDYPRSKLDIKLVLEGDDLETIEACKKAGLEANVELIVVPPGLPRTKPKALNYALKFARGQFVTIYDAEDLPQPDQLKKAVLAFRKAPWDVVCLQARLNYFNWNENWLTRLFTLEYSLWFDWYLPGLEAMGIPIPLGGTSNHFRIEVVRAVGGWDPFNVTEDADLGVRFTMGGWRVGVLDSTTFEEANCHLGNWVRQRSRWVKGYMQTWLVYMRRPWRTFRKLGWKGFLGFQAFIGGSVLGPLAFPPLAAMFLYWLATGSRALDPLFTPPVLDISLLLLLLGNGLLMYFHLLAAWYRGRHALVFWAVTLPLYYLLMSAAAWKALWQLAIRPHYWEKTEHGLTRMDIAEEEGDAVGAV
ncbi:MAG: glycosyltransferase [Bryobacteraceae bacterium]|nr:glycosyltransferase [Bryobacteraceae bacterium]